MALFLLRNLYFRTKHSFMISFFSQFVLCHASNNTTSRNIVIVIVNSKLLKRHSKAKRRAPAYSRALRQIRGIFQRIVRGKLRSGCQEVRGGRLGVKTGVV